MNNKLLLVLTLLALSLVFTSCSFLKPLPPMYCNLLPTENPGLILNLPLTSEYSTSMNGYSIMIDDSPQLNFFQNFGASINTNYTSFDGSTNYMKTDKVLVSSPTELTIAARIKHEQGGSTYEGALHQGATYTIGGSTYWLGVDSTDKLVATIGANTGITSTWNAGATGVTAVDGQWYHLAASWNGTEVKVYLDGELKKQYALTTYTNVLTPTRIGATDDALHYQFKGDIADVRIYNISLTETEIINLYEMN